MSPHADTPRAGKRIAIALAIAALALGYVALFTLLAWIAMRPLVAFDVESTREKIVLSERRLPGPLEPLPVMPAHVATELAMERDPFE